MPRVAVPALPALAVVAAALLATLQATLQGVYSAALYRYATNDGRPVPDFGPN